MSYPNKRNIIGKYINGYEILYRQASYQYDIWEKSILTNSNHKLYKKAINEFILSNL